MTSYSSNWFTLLFLCPSAPLILCGDRFDCGSRQVKCEPVDLAVENFDVLLWDVSISRFVFDELDLVKFLHDIFCFESDSVVSYSSGTVYSTLQGVHE